MGSSSQWKVLANDLSIYLFIFLSFFHSFSFTSSFFIFYFPLSSHFFLFLFFLFLFIWDIQNSWREFFWKISIWLLNTSLAHADGFCNFNVNVLIHGLWNDTFLIMSWIDSIIWELWIFSIFSFCLTSANVHARIKSGDALLLLSVCLWTW